MKAFLYLFYHFVKLLVLIVFRLFYSKKIILNQENLRINNPCILLSNHPNTLHDPLHVASKVDNRMVHFLANAGLYTTAFSNWFFTTFYCIKIERTQDVKDRKISNEKAFEACDRFLSAGGCLYIAPEGTSKLERHIRKIKTGTARIALSAESQNDFKLGLTILPVGLSYSDSTSFQEKILVNVGEPILVANYQTAYQADPFKAVQNITNDIEEALRALIVNTTDEAEESLLAQIEKIYQSDHHLEFDQEFFRSKKLLNDLREMKAHQPKKFEDLSGLLNKYNTALVAIPTDDYSLTHIDRKLSFSSYVAYLLGFLPFLWGWINNYLLCFIPAWLNRKLNLYIGYSSTVKSLAGMITLPLFYSIQTFLVYYLTQSWVWSLIYVFSLIPFGLFAWKYYQRLRKDFSIRQLKKKNKARPNQIKTLQEMRAQIKVLLGVSNP